MTIWIVMCDDSNDAISYPVAAFYAESAALRFAEDERAKQKASKKRRAYEWSVIAMDLK